MRQIIYLTIAVILLITAVELRDLSEGVAFLLGTFLGFVATILAKIHET